MTASEACNVVALGISGDVAEAPVVVVRRTVSPWGLDNEASFAVRVSKPETNETTCHWRTALPEALARARHPRLVTFLAGRFCAEQALLASGMRPPAVVAFGEDRAPVWPAGYVGSITHTDDFAGAVVAVKNEVVGIGIDTEKVLSEAAADDVRQTVAPELDGLNFPRLGADGYSNSAVLISCVFSAKETIYKCLHPVVGEFFEFGDVSVTKLESAEGRIHFVLNRALGVFPRDWPFVVHFSLADGRVHTSAILRSTQVPAVSARPMS